MVVHFCIRWLVKCRDFLSACPTHSHLLPLLAFQVHTELPRQQDGSPPSCRASMIGHLRLLPAAGADCIADSY